MVKLMKTNVKEIIEQDYDYGFHDQEKAVFETGKGLTEDIVRTISKIKKEPSWMLDIRLKAYHKFLELNNPTWGPDLSFINFDDYIYYVKPSEKVAATWKDVPDDIKNTFKKLGIPEAEAKFLNGVSTQYDSEVVYHSMIKELEDQNVIFTDTDTALQKHPDIFKKYFGKLVPYTDNKYAALNTAVWSGGSFVYIPKGVHLKKPIQSYFRINAQSAGQFERTMIIVEEGASVHYVEGCTAPVYSVNNLHAAVVEVYVQKDANCRYTTIQNWSNNVLNLVTKRCLIKENANMSWIDGNIGAKLNMKYPCSILAGPYATSDCISIAVAKQGVTQDAGAKMIHLAPHTKSKIISKGVSYGNGDNRFRGLVKIAPGAHHSRSFVECDTLLIDSESRSDTIPTEEVYNNTSTLNHEAKITKISEEQLFYLMSKGIAQDKAEQLIVMGFLEVFAKELPMEYAVELNRLIKLDMSGSVG